MKKGFTLVELAIVLVVIGLLLGMAFKGKALVDAARTKADINKIKKVETALNVYVSKYNIIPGKKTDGTFTDRSITDEIKKEGMMKDSDFKLASFTKYIHFVGCEVLTKGGGPVYFPATITEDQNLCITITSDEARSDTVVTTPNMQINELTICYLETLLDDGDILTGDGRKTTFQHDGFDRTFKDCSKYAKSGNLGGSSFAYLYKVY